MTLDFATHSRMTNNHRTVLARAWLGGSGLVNWIMLNPSTATEWVNDPTVRKCIGFSKRWGFNGLIITNLFSFRATRPAELREMATLDYARAVGLNDGPIIEAVSKANLVVAAWGAHGRLCGRDADVMQRVIPTTDLFCIGLTRDGMPLHPCRANYTYRPAEFRVTALNPECDPFGYCAEHMLCERCRNCVGHCTCPPQAMRGDTNQIESDKTREVLQQSSLLPRD